MKRRRIDERKSGKGGSREEEARSGGVEMKGGKIME